MGGAGCVVPLSRLLDPACNPYATARTMLQVENTFSPRERRSGRMSQIIGHLLPYLFIFFFFSPTWLLTLLRLLSYHSCDPLHCRAVACSRCKCKDAFAELPPSCFSTSEGKLTFLGQSNSHDSSACICELSPSSCR